MIERTQNSCAGRRMTRDEKTTMKMMIEKKCATFEKKKNLYFEAPSFVSLQAAEWKYLQLFASVFVRSFGSRLTMSSFVAVSFHPSIFIIAALYYWYIISIGQGAPHGLFCCHFNHNERRSYIMTSIEIQLKKKKKIFYKISEFF